MTGKIAHARIGEYLERLSAGELHQDIATEIGCSGASLTRYMQRHCGERYTDAMIAGLRSQLDQHLQTGNITRYRQLLAVADQRYPGMFRFPYRTQAKPARSISIADLASE